MESRAEKFSGTAGKVSIEAPNARVIIVRLTGHVTADLVPPLIASLNRRATGELTDYFFDAWELSSYDSPLRIELTNWFARRRGMVRSLHTVTKSKLVQMGISVANVVLKIIENHPTCTAFDAAITARLAELKTA